MWNYPRFHMEKKRIRTLRLNIPHLCLWFYIWIHCYTKYTVFLCGWWYWWSSRVEMGFSCSCLSLTLAQQYLNTLGHKRSVCLPGRISTILPSWAIWFVSKWFLRRRCSTVSIPSYSDAMTTSVCLVTLAAWQELPHNLDIVKYCHNSRDPLTFHVAPSSG